VHLFLPDARESFQLEHLWGKAGKVDAIADSPDGVSNNS